MSTRTFYKMLNDSLSSSSLATTSLFSSSFSFLEKNAAAAQVGDPQEDDESPSPSSTNRQSNYTAKRRRVDEGTLIETATCTETAPETESNAPNVQNDPPSLLSKIRNIRYKLLMVLLDNNALQDKQEAGAYEQWSSAPDGAHHKEKIWEEDDFSIENKFSTWSE